MVSTADEPARDAIRRRGLDEVACIRSAIVFLGLEDLAAVRDEIDRLLQGYSERRVSAVRVPSADVGS
jgi:hypothetical protein